MPIFPCTRQEKPNCPLLKITHLGAILKLTSFRIIIESFSGKEILNDEDANANTDPLRKTYLVFSIRDAIIIGKVPGCDSSVCKKGKVEDSATQVRKTEFENNAACKFIFFVEHQDSEAVQIVNNVPSLCACVYGYILGKRETALTCQGGRHRNIGSQGVNEGDLGKDVGEVRTQGVKEDDVKAGGI